MRNMARRSGARTIVEGKACGLCRDRKVLCDRTHPRCLRCLKSGRQCDGYGMRLSWPSRNDRKRSMIARLPGRQAQPKYQEHTEFINVGSWDIEMYDELSLNGVRRHMTKRPLPYSGQPTTIRALRWTPQILRDPEKKLIQYFDTTASHCLLTAGDDNSDLKSTLIRMLFSASSPATSAVLGAILAFASLHMGSPQHLAARYSGSALQLMRKASFEGIGSAEASLHCAAGLLLGTSESWFVARSYSSWAMYLCAARQTAWIASRDKLLREDPDLSRITGWLHYSTVLLSFSLMHWPLEDSEDEVQESLFSNGLIVGPFGNEHCMGRFESLPSDPIYDILYHLHRGMSIIVDPSDALFHTKEHQRQRKQAIANVKRIDPTQSAYSLAFDGLANGGSAQLAQLYQLTALIFLERCSQSIEKDSKEISDMVDEGYSIMRNMGKCNWPLIFLILGIEAQTDTRRLELLNLVRKGQQDPDARPIRDAKSVVETIWNQQDLGSNSVSYIAMMQNIIRSCRTMPKFT